MSLSIAILAAGKGVRMKSDIPKVLHQLAGRSMLEHVIDTAESLNPESIYVVHGDEGKIVREKLQDLKVEWVLQKNPKGTADAVKKVLPLLNPKHQLLVLYGDVPLISAKTLKRLIDRTPKDAIGWLTEKVQEPRDLGRIIRDDDGNPIAIVEAKDATKAQKKITEINAGICLLPAQYLLAWLPQIKNDNSQGEFYLTDIFAMAVAHGVSMTTVSPESSLEVFGVNNNIQLAYLERIFQYQQAEKYMHQGLTILDPHRFDVRGQFTFGQDVIVDVNAVIEGRVKIGKNCYLGPNVVLKNVVIGNHVEIKANSVIEDAKIADGCCIGPFSRIRPGTTIAENSKVGNFVEIKKSEIGQNTKVSHLTYIGDSSIGNNVNVGAGTVTCNYDGVNKFQTEIEDDVFIGSGTLLVAPVKVGKNAFIAAGSTINHDAPKDKLTIARSRQVTVEHWKRPVKKEKE